ncbi:biotin holocarboxylase synthetase [Rhizophlyctis rosea]|uniref:Biotin holocarboxylase synthetase n=1 Tax=Rhizophlyctis rosea TaxID=64517 RepID=A0AAD5X999_9FUNG|nr:biotin holocarboxylase synthetase [Rhizophlyctis rosea]
MNVLVYTGPGTARGPIDHTILTLRTHLSSSYDVIPVDAPTLANEPWQQTTSLLVIPGGRDVPYVSHLSPDATTKIRAWVESGGKYLGICAGAYFACERVEFEVGRAGYEVTGGRPLKFLPGIGKGSVVGGFEYGMEEVGKAIEIQLNATELGWDHDSLAQARVYVNGGPYFHLNEPSPYSTTSQPATKVLATYSDPSLPARHQPAMVECQVSKGIAILTGPHIEYQLDLLSRHSTDPNVARLLPSLQQSAPTQQKLIRSLLQRFGLRLNDEKEGESTVQDTLDPVLSTLHLCGESDVGTGSVHTLLDVLGERAQSSDRSITLDDSVNIIHVIPPGSISSVTNLPPPTPSDDSACKQPITIVAHTDSSFPLPSQTPKFNITRYFEELHAERGKLGVSGRGDGGAGFGTPLLYGEIMGSTQTLLEKNVKFAETLPSGLVCVASHQVAGRGRGRNTWISQSGCLMFTLALHHTDSKSVVFLQYLIGLAVVEALRSAPGLEALPVHLKWPNDIYCRTDEGLKKIGGILVTSSYMNGKFSLFVGCGINIANAKPTTSINELIQLHNQRHNISIPLLSCEQGLAKILTRFEMLYHEFVAASTDSSFTFAFEPFLDRYYRVWLHSGQSVVLGDANNAKATIVGVDSSGLLRAVVESGSEAGREKLLQPDGNSFDMLKGLIVRKK